MSEINQFAQASREKAAEAARAMRDAARMVKVFEPSQVDIDDAKRTAWNRTVTKIKEIYGLDSSVIQPHKSMDEYTVTSGGYIEGPAYIGQRAFSVGSRINVPDEDDPGLDFGEDTIVPYLYPRGSYGVPASEVYTSIAEALENYAETGQVHENAIGDPQEIPDSLDSGTPTLKPARESQRSGLFSKLKKLF